VKIKKMLAKILKNSEIELSFEAIGAKV